MRLVFSFMVLMAVVGSLTYAQAATDASKTDKGRSNSEKASLPLEITADESLEYYEKKRLYVARTNAKAVRGDMTVSADILTALERDKTKKPPTDDKTTVGAGDIEQMTAEGNVIISDPRMRITGEHAVYDVDKHKMIITGKNLKYESAKETVTATDSLEYYENTKLAVARGHAVAEQATRHIAGDILSAEFIEGPNGDTQLYRLTAKGHVVVITKSSSSSDKDKNTGDISRGDSAVYNAKSNLAVLQGNVKVTRKDGTELSGDVGEVDFNKNENRLRNTGGSTGRVRALLPTKKTDNTAP